MCIRDRSYCSVVKDLFDPLLVYKKLYHFITVLFVCQELFWFILLFWTLSFCNNFYIISFLILSVKNFLMIFILHCSDRSPSVTFIDYHIWQLMSRSFFILFRVKNGIWCYIFPPLFQRRWLSYHSCIQYVNYFFHLLETNFIS